MTTLNDFYKEYGIETDASKDIDSSVPEYRDNTQFDDMFESDTVREKN